MKSLALAILVLTSAPAFANVVIKDSESATAAELLARQVIIQNLATPEIRADLQVALEGAGTGSLHADITDLSCEPAGGNVDCVLSVTSSPDQKPSTSYALSVKVFQGSVKDAFIEQ